MVSMNAQIAHRQHTQVLIYLRSLLGFENITFHKVNMMVEFSFIVFGIALTYARV